MIRFACLLVLLACTAFACSTAPYDSLPSGSVSPGAFFKEDQALVDDSTAARILSTRLVVPPRIRLALVNLTPTARARWDYLRVADIQLDEDLERALNQPLAATPRVQTLQPVPRILLPENLTPAQLRATALRTQSDMLLGYVVEVQVLRRNRTLDKGTAQAVATVHAFLLDSRTGLVPFMTTVTRLHTRTRQSQDETLQLTYLKARYEAHAAALAEVGTRLSAFLAAQP